MFNIVQPKGLNMLYKQDIYNSDEILSQILKPTVKMDGLLHKLGQHGTEEAAQNLVKLTFILCYIYIYLLEEIKIWGIQWVASKPSTPICTTKDC